jgi:RND family efflux transporter MFP subunit
MLQKTPKLLTRSHIRKLAVLLTVTLVSCGRFQSGPEKVAEPPVTLSLGSEDILVVGQSELSTGPIVTGSIQPERRADLRAEVSAVIIRVAKENGDPVRRGEVLAVLDDTAIRDSLTAAEESARASGQSLESAERQLQRLKSLQAQGMTSSQALDDAEVRRNNARSDWVAAKTRIVSARQQLERTQVRAPFDGVVSARKASAGDTVQIGRELIQVIDPASMRFDGLVAADQMQSLKPGQAVYFKVNGFGQTELNGRIRRIDAAANVVSRQVAVIVDFVGKERPPIVGLYAEGRVDTQTRKAIMLVEGALVREGDKTSVWLLEAGQVYKRPVVLGERDPRSGRFVILSGLKPGDRVLRSPGSRVSEAQAYSERASVTPNVSPKSASGGQ